MKILGFIIMLAGCLLLGFEVLLSMGEAHLLLKNLHWFLGFVLVAVGLIAFGLYIVKKAP